MGMETKGFAELEMGLKHMADAVSEHGGGKVINKALNEGADIILEQAKSNANRLNEKKHEKLHPGQKHLKDMLNKSRIKGGRVRGKSISIGVHRKDWDGGDEYYPAYVEFGHGGPHPAPPHPYIRSAYDVKQEDAYKIIKDAVLDAFKKL